MRPILERFFQPPEMPYIKLPLVFRLDGDFRNKLHDLFDLAYFAGVKDGLISGAMIGFVLAVIIYGLFRKV